MSDEIDRLRECPELLSLLGHYAELGKADRQVWQDRRMELEGIPAKDLSRLHGELIAYEWVEQNTGVVTPGRPGVVAGCYRVTLNGLRAMRRLQTGAEDTEAEAEAQAAEEVRETKPRGRRKSKAGEPPVLGAATEATQGPADGAKAAPVQAAEAA